MKGQACKKLQNPLSFCAYFQVFSTELSSSHSGLFDSHWPSIYTLLKLFLGILRSCQGVTSDFKVILYREILQSIFSAFSSHEWTIGLAKVWGKIEQFMFSLTFLRLVFPIRPIAIIYISLSLSYNNQSKLVVHVCTVSENQWQSSKNSINAGWPAYPLNSCLDL